MPRSLGRQTFVIALVQFEKDDVAGLGALGCVGDENGIGRHNALEACPLRT